MASRTFAPLLRRPLAVSVGFTSLLAGPLILQHRLPIQYTYCDTSPSPISSRDWVQRREYGSVPPPEKLLSARSIRQISTGSILGLVGGVAVSVFSKTLALLFGASIVFVQFLESRGIHLVPYQKIQRYVTNVDLKSAMQKNVPLKISFGITFALAAFAEF